MNTLIHSGPLSLSSLDHAIQRRLFRPSRIGRSAGDDPLFMGWENARLSDRYLFIFKNLTMVTAEGVAMLANIIAALRSVSGVTVNIEWDVQSQSWAQSSGIDQLGADRWAPLKGGGPIHMMSSSVLPLAKVVMTSPDMAYTQAERLAEGCTEMVLTQSEIHHAGMASTIRLFAQEGLLNVLDHAYGNEIMPEAFVVATLTSIPHPEDRDWDVFSSSAERDWYQRWFGEAEMLELAISDYGLSIPATLWPAYRSRHPESIAHANIESKAGRVVRSEKQTRVLEWAFHHESSRRLMHAPAPDVSDLNWRGLHRAMNLAAAASGVVAITSGQARAGFVFEGDRAIPISPLHPAQQHELPGTTLIIRLPVVYNLTQAALQPSGIHRVSSPDDFGSLETFNLSAILPSHTPARSIAVAQSGTVAIVHPLTTITDHRSVLRPWTPPGIVELHVCLEAETSVLGGLQAFDETSRHNLGSPRLMGFIDFRGSLEWRLVGLLPEASRALVHTLERDHYYTFDDSASLNEWGHTLATLYPTYFSISNTVLRLASHFRLSAADQQTILQMAFIAWTQSNSNLWLTDENTYIRLTSGRIVKKHVSVLQMVYSSELLRQLLGQRLASLIDSIRMSVNNAIIVADGPASYYIARLLGSGIIGDGVLITLPSAYREPVIVFVDCIQKGSTLHHLLQSIPTCVHIICAVDLRGAQAEQHSSFEGVPLSALVQYPFDPEEVVDPESAILADAQDILEVDPVTHIPMKVMGRHASYLGTTESRDEFLTIHPELFRYGLQASGGRIQIVTLDLDKLIKDHPDRLITWIRECLEAVPQSDGRQPDSIILFTRAESSVDGIIRALAKSISEVFGDLPIYHAYLPVVPRGRKEVFGRPSPHLLTQLTSLGGQRRLVGSTGQFVAIYLDDACVTGKSLINFLILMHALEGADRPHSILFIPLLSRFSPAEEQLYSTVLGAQRGSRVAGVSFSFTTLFRMQMRSYDHLAATDVYQSVQLGADEEGALFGEAYREMRDSLASLRQNLSNLDRNLGPRYIRNSLLNYQAHVDGSVSVDVIRIRHLISLQEQNMGVLGELLAMLTNALAANDVSLITMIALEPSLLDVSPLRRECNADILALAIKATTSGHTLGLRADALFVISKLDNPLDHMLATLNGIQDEPRLIRLVIILISLYAKRYPEDAHRAADGLRSCTLEAVHQPYRGLGQLRLEAHAALSPAKLGSTKGDIEHALGSFFAATSYHGSLTRPLEALGSWLLEKRSDRATRPAEAIYENCRNVIALFRKFVIPAFRALILWCDMHRNQERINSLAVSAESVGSTLDRLEPHLLCPDDAMMDDETVELLAELWSTVRSGSLTRPTNISMGKYPSTEGVGVLDRFLPEFFSIPQAAISFLAVQRGASIPVRTTPDKQLVVVAVPLGRLFTLLDLILADMQSHGVPESFQAHCEVRLVPRVLVVELSNAIRLADIKGSQQSQARARAEATSLGLEIDFSPPTASGQPYLTTVRFPNPIICSEG